MSRRHNPNRAKLHLTYTIVEITAVFDIGKSTVSNWFRDGLKTVDRKRPLLVAGVELRAFINNRMAATKRPCEPGEIYCVACKRPKRPVGNTAVIKEVSETAANMIGVCPDCSRLMHRRVAMRKLFPACGGLALTTRAP